MHLLTGKQKTTFEICAKIMLIRPALQEKALREFLEGLGLLPPETYLGAHIVVQFPLSSGETTNNMCPEFVLCSKW